MERYRNLSGKSGVGAYAIGDDFIAIRFISGVIYWYTVESVGVQHFAEMKRLATQGRGLGTYISTHPEVSAGYANREPDE
ncbi:MAG: hypothetical protein WCA85_08240 [Paraburkholderia sp.]|uniref:hypothetical protein n=1 Tax=Paraburkholderia sp. TaxID=1926495 RepID=UPI003C3197F6